jgi:hypothetical protein
MEELDRLEGSVSDISIAGGLEFHCKDIEKAGCTKEISQIPYQKRNQSPPN